MGKENRGNEIEIVIDPTETVVAVEPIGLEIVVDCRRPCCLLGTWKHQYGNVGGLRENVEVDSEAVGIIGNRRMKVTKCTHQVRLKLIDPSNHITHGLVFMTAILSSVE